MQFFWYLFWIAFFNSATYQAHAALIAVTDEIQTEIIHHYSENNCEGARKIIAKINPLDLRPNVMAIAAYCEPKNQDPEHLFAEAEKQSPTGDLILVLHAKYRYRRSRDASKELWEKVLMIARNDFFIEMAKDHLAKVVSGQTNEKPLDLSPSTHFIQLLLAGVRDENALPTPYAFNKNIAPANAYSINANYNFRRWLPFGSIGIQDSAKIKQYPTKNIYNSFSNELEIPIAIHVVTSKDLIFRPILNYESFASKPLRLQYGLGMKGAVYNNSYIQSVQAIIYNERVYPSSISVEQGAHYRFEYAWDFFFPAWNISNLLFIEHVSSSPTANFLGNRGDFVMSHNDFGLNLKFEKTFSRFTLGLDPKIFYRLDTNDSHYNNISGAPIAKTRADWNYSVQANLSFPLIRSLQLYTWYEFAQISSNLGSLDYQNFNYQNHTIGLGVKTSWSSY